MDVALAKAIYYVKMSENKYNVVTELVYDGTKEGFEALIGSFPNNISVRELFGNPHENINYEICQAVSDNYDKILIFGNLQQASLIVSSPATN